MVNRLSRLQIFSFVLSLALLSVGCGGDHSTAPEEVPIPTEAIFTVSPVPVELLSSITPVGAHNKVLPVEHTYWLTCGSENYHPSTRPCNLGKFEIRSPGDGVVRDLDASEDGYLTIVGPGGTDFYMWRFGHVTPLVEEGERVEAGQVVARMHAEHGFDFGLWRQFGEPPEGASTKRRWQGYAFFPEHPISQFVEPLRSQLTELLPPIEGERLGRAFWDIPGTAGGTWFRDDAPPGEIVYSADHWHTVLHLARHVEVNSTRIVSFGDPPSELEFFIVAVDPSAPDWEDITPESGVVELKLWHLSWDPETPARPDLNVPAGKLLIEMLDEETILAEYFDTHKPVGGFSAPRIYTR